MFEDLIKKKKENYTFIIELPNGPCEDRLLLFDDAERTTSYWDGNNWIVFSNWNIKKEE